MKITNIFTSVVGGHRDGDLISVNNGYFDAVEPLQVSWRCEPDPKEIHPETTGFTRYRREMLTAYFNGKYYARHFFVRNCADIEMSKNIYNQYFKNQLCLFVNKI